LSREELIEGFRSIKGINFNERDIDEMIKRVDADGSGDINYSEFISTAVNLEKLFTGERLEKAFKVFDKDGDNSISI
jgi:calcium-dependent protein kinase